MTAIFIVLATIFIFIFSIIIISYFDFSHKIKKYEKNKFKAFWCFIILFISGMINSKPIEELLNEKNNECSLEKSEDTLVKTLEESINKLASLEDDYDDKNKINIKTSNEETYIFKKDERGTI